MDEITGITSFVVRIPQERAYLESGATDFNSFGYRVSRKNSTIYPSSHQSVLIKVVDGKGNTGWGESFGVIAPEVTKQIVDHVIGPFVLGRKAADVRIINQMLYDLMRVRGYFSGFYNDAVAGIDIALWDLLGKQRSLPLADLLGGRQHDRIPCYVSGLARETPEERLALALEYRDKGFRGFKIPLVYHDNDRDELVELKSLRGHLGGQVDLMIDMHWNYTAAEAVKKIRSLDTCDLYFAEAPVKPEDVDGQAFVAARCGVPVAVGEEFANVYPVVERLKRHCMSIVQPETGHTGITQFLQIAEAARSFNCRVMPHATIGLGIFLAASVACTSTLTNSGYHEYQPSILDGKLQYLTGTLSCAAGYYSVPDGVGIGVEPDMTSLSDFIER